MASPEDFASLWEQAINDENYEEAAALEIKRQAAEAATQDEPEASSGSQEQRAILNSEFYWFGGLADHGRGPIDGPRDIM